MPKGAASLADAPALSREAKHRLHMLEYAQIRSVSATCRHFGIARSTFYRWQRRYVPSRLGTLENHSSRPRRVRQRTWTSSQAIAVRELRRSFPYMGKHKLAIVLRDQHIVLSVSTIGRILCSLRATHQLHEPRSTTSSHPHARHKRPYAVRKPKEYEASIPGALIQVDTMQLRPLPTLIRQHFTSVDSVSRWAVFDVRQSASATTARDFLAQIVERMPFPVRAIQVDGGSEFMAQFEIACRERSITLFVLPPRSPKLNGKAERLNRTCRTEHYELDDGDLDLPSHRDRLGHYEHAYNHHRPHQALGYLTPADFLARGQL